MALVCLLSIFDGTEIWLLFILINDPKDPIHRLLALDGLLLLITEAPGQVRSVQELVQLLICEYLQQYDDKNLVLNFQWRPHLSMVFLLGNNRPDIIFAVKKGKELVGCDGFKRGLDILGTGFELAPGQHSMSYQAYIHS